MNPRPNSMQLYIGFSFCLKLDSIAVYFLADLLSAKSLPETLLSRPPGEFWYDIDVDVSLRHASGLRQSTRLSVAAYSSSPPHHTPTRPLLSSSLPPHLFHLVPSYAPSKSSESSYLSSLAITSETARFPAVTSLLLVARVELLFFSTRALV